MPGIITFADLGRRSNLKTRDILPVIDSFDELDFIICRINKGDKRAKGAIVESLHYLLYGIGKVFNKFPARGVEEWLFDYFASRKIKKTDVLFFHPARLDRCIKKSKKLGIKTVGITTIAESRFVKKIRDEEFKILGLDNKNESKFFWKDGIENQFDYLIALSDYAKDTYIQNGFSKEIFNTTLDINNKRFYPNKIKQDKFIVGFVSASIGIMRGLHYLLDAWEELDLKNIELRIIGKFTELEDYYMERISNMDNVKYYPFKKEIEKEYNMFDILVMPSLTEGFPKVLIEAMSCGVPAITTEHAKGLVDDENGFIIPIRNSSLIKEKIEYLYNNPEIRYSMSKKAQESVLNKESFPEQIKNIYEILNKR